MEHRMSGNRGSLDDLEAFLAEECPECGTPGPRRHLSAVGGCGTCADNDPRPVFTPLRNKDAGVAVYDMVLPKWPDAPPWAPFRDRIPRGSKCYQTPSGQQVHVQPECRCKR
jgi:hypothetical protein